MIVAFGNRKPLLLERKGAAKGIENYQFKLPAHRYIDADTSTVEWTDMVLDLAVGNAGRAVRHNGKMDQLVIMEKMGTATLRGLTFRSDQKQDASKLWLGDMHMGIASISLLAADQSSFSISNVQLDAGIAAKGKFVETRHDFKIGEFRGKTETVSDLHLGMRITNIDAKAMARARIAMAKLETTDKSPAQHMALILPELKEVAKASLMQGAALEVDDLSLRYHGHLAQLKGRVQVDAPTDSDFNAIADIARKIVARFELSVPMALLHDASNATAGAAANTSNAPRSLEKMAATMVEQGYATVENGVLHATIEFAKGQFRVNGKAVSPLSLWPSLPSTPPTPVVTRQSASRQLQGDCPPIVYPKEALRAEQTGTTRIRFQVDLEGAVQAASVLESSKWPVLDQASLDIVNACKFKPDARDAVRASEWQVRTFVWKLDGPPAPATTK